MFHFDQLVDNHYFGFVFPDPPANTYQFFKELINNISTSWPGSSSSVLKQKGECQSGGNKKTKRVIYSKKWTFLYPWYADVRVHLFVSRGKKCLFFGKYDVFCFLVNSVFRFALFDLIPTRYESFEKFWWMSFTFSIILLLPLIMRSVSSFQIGFIILFWSILLLVFSSLKSATLTGPNMFTSTSW